MPLTAETFLQDSSEPPLDEDEIREALACALTEQAPPALVRLVGKQAYSRCVVLRKGVKVLMIELFFELLIAWHGNLPVSWQSCPEILGDECSTSIHNYQFWVVSGRCTLCLSQCKSYWPS